MGYVIVFGTMFVFVAIISWLWVRGIDNMRENHPDYTGDEFLNWNNEDIDDEFSRQSKNNNKKS
jgi:hypothetical protein